MSVEGKCCLTARSLQYAPCDGSDIVSDRSIIDKHSKRGICILFCESFSAELSFSARITVRRLYLHTGSLLQWRMYAYISVCLPAWRIVRL